MCLFGRGGRPGYGSVKLHHRIGVGKHYSMFAHATIEAVVASNLGLEFSYLDSHREYDAQDNKHEQYAKEEKLMAVMIHAVLAISFAVGAGAPVGVLFLVLRAIFLHGFLF